MQYRVNTKSGNNISVLGFGCMRLPSRLGVIDIDKSETVIMEAIKQGVNFFDTAYIYPGSEVALGRILDRNKVRDKVYIGTKLPLSRCNSYEDFDLIFNEQLTRLKTNYIDYYFMHNISRHSDWKRLCELGIEGWIERKKHNGQIRQIGFSFHGVRDEFIKVVDAYDWDYCMIQYNYINSHFQAGVTGLRHAHSRGIPVFVMEPLLGGGLVKNLPKKAVALFRRSNPNATNASWALRWIWNQPEITMLLSGMNELSQVAENVGLAVDAKVESMTEEELTVVDEVTNLFLVSFKIPCTGCNYCLPCPKNINIPDSFTAYNISYSVSRFAAIHQYATTIGGLKSIYSAADCTKCGKCEKECPQNVEIIKSLEAVYKRLEPFWFRAGMAVARKFLK